MIPDALVLIDRPFAGCATLTLNRPQAMNALSRALCRELAQTFRSLQRDAQTRVIVLTGAGKAFCAGLDLKELGSSRDPAAALVPDSGEDPIAALAEFAGPVIAAINGAAITGGFELALACDVLIASTGARFADTHARVGVLPGWGLSQRLPRLIGMQRAKELAFTGNFINAQRAEAWGLVNRVVEPVELLPQALALAQDMLSTDAATLLAYKRLIDDGAALSLDDALRLEKERSAAWARRIEPAAIEQRREQMLMRARAESASNLDERKSRQGAKENSVDENRPSRA